MPNAIWKGALSFGLLHVPVALYPASSESRIDFDWLDKRTMDPVGYKRINKRTGHEIAKDNVVKGVKVERDDYVLLSDEEIKAAYPRTTQTIEIESFVEAPEIRFTHFEKPYYLEPLAKSEKVYMLLREAMLEAGVVGIARVVIHTKEHLAAVIPSGSALVLNTLRWASEIRATDEIKLPPAGKKALKTAELKLAHQLIGNMTTAWDPEHYSDKFTDAVQALVAKRVKAGKTETVEAMEEAPPAPSNVIDLTELLSKSLGTRKPTASKGSPRKKRTSRKSPTKGTKTRKSA